MHFPCVLWLCRCCCCLKTPPVSSNTQHPAPNHTPLHSLLPSGTLTRVGYLAYVTRWLSLLPSGTNVQSLQMYVTLRVCAPFTSPSPCLSLHLQTAVCLRCAETLIPPSSHRMGTPTLHVRNSDSPPRSKLIIKDIYITNGASRAVCMTLTALLRSAQDGVLVPIPQYPLYSASIQLHNGTLLPYYLDEKDNWSFSLPAIERTIMKACVTGETTPLPSFSFSFSFHLFVFFFSASLLLLLLIAITVLRFLFSYMYTYIYMYICV